jgi:hypothetical protein
MVSALPPFHSYTPTNFTNANLEVAEDTIIYGSLYGNRDAIRHHIFVSTLESVITYRNLVKGSRIR